MWDKFYIGLDLTGFENNGIQRPISRVTLQLDGENVLTAGDDSGLELTADCPHATQAMVNSLLAQLKGSTYKMYSAADANLDPSAELGDGITASGVYSVISRLADDGMGYPSPSAPGKEELEDEYPAGGPMTQAFDRKISETRSTITKTAEQIKLEVQKIENDIVTLDTTFTVELGKITSSIQDIDGKYSKLEQSINGFSLSVSNGETSSTIELKAGETVISSQNITMSGLVTFKGLESGETTIDGGCLKTGTIESMKINSSTITGSIFRSETGTTSISISGGRLQLKHSGTNVGYIGTSAWRLDSSKKCLMFDLDYTGDFMTWARKPSEDGNYIVRLLYAATELPLNDVYRYVADRIYLEAESQFRNIAYFGDLPSRPAGSIYGLGYSSLNIYADSGGFVYMGVGSNKMLEFNIGGIDCYTKLDMNSNAILNSSDERLKTNIEESVRSALDVIRSMKTYSFDWIETGKHEELGFIAQQLEAEVNADFVEVSIEDGHYSTKDLKMIPYLVKAIQELSEQVEGLCGTACTVRKSRGRLWRPGSYTIEEKTAFSHQMHAKTVADKPKKPEPVTIPSYQKGARP